MSRRRLVSKDVSALAMGATLLGSGGGGGTDLGARILVKALGDRSVELVAAGDLPDDVVIVHAGLAGSPDVYAERLIDPQDLVRAIQAVVDAVGQPLGAIGILEIGGINALLAPAAAALLGVPLVDGDLMGRTYPTLLQHVCRARPSLASRRGRRAIGRHGPVPAVVPGHGGALQPALRQGVRGAAAAAYYPVAPADLAEFGVAGSVSACLALGERFLAAQSHSLRALAQAVSALHLVSGRVVSITPSEADCPGTLVLSNPTTGEIVRVDFRDEFLVLAVDGEVRHVVPDVIVVLEGASHRVLHVDEVHVGQTIAVLALPSVPRPAATETAFLGPVGFGLDPEVLRV